MQSLSETRIAASGQRNTRTNEQAEPRQVYQEIISFVVVFRRSVIILRQEQRVETDSMSRGGERRSGWQRPSPPASFSHFVQPRSALRSQSPELLHYSLQVVKFKRPLPSDCVLTLGAKCEAAGDGISGG